jgi:hypothetical protein
MWFARARASREEREYGWKGHSDLLPLFLDYVTGAIGAAIIPLYSPFFTFELLYGTCWRQCTFANSDSARPECTRGRGRRELDGGECVEHGRVAVVHRAEGERSHAVRETKVALCPKVPSVVLAEDATEM